MANRIVCKTRRSADVAARGAGLRQRARWLSGKFAQGALSIQGNCHDKDRTPTNRSSWVAVADFRPVLEIEDSQFDRLQHEMTTVSRRLAWIATSIGPAAGAISVTLGPASWGLTETSSTGVLIYTYLMACLISIFFTALILRTVGQLRLVGRWDYAEPS